MNSTQIVRLTRWALPWHRYPVFWLSRQIVRFFTTVDGRYSAQEPPPTHRINFRAGFLHGGLGGFGEDLVEIFSHRRVPSARRFCLGGGTLTRCGKNERKTFVREGVLPCCTGGLYIPSRRIYALADCMASTHKNQVRRNDPTARLIHECHLQVSFPMGHLMGCLS